MKLRILTIAVLLFLSGSLLAQTSLIKQITSKEAVKMLNKNIVVLDVRTADEFNQGHIKGAINIDIKQANALDKISKLNPEATYLVHCRTSHRSTTAVDYMLSNGFKKIYQMMDGYSGWSQNNYPVTK